MYERTVENCLEYNYDISRFLPFFLFLLFIYIHTYIIYIYIYICICSLYKILGETLAKAQYLPTSFAHRLLQCRRICRLVFLNYVYNWPYKWLVEEVPIVNEKGVYTKLWTRDDSEGASKCY